MLIIFMTEAPKGLDDTSEMAENRDDPTDVLRDAASPSVLLPIESSIAVSGAFLISIRYWLSFFQNISSAALDLSFLRTI